MDKNWEMSDKIYRFSIKENGQNYYLFLIAAYFSCVPIIRMVSGTEEKELRTKRLRNGSCSISWPRKAYFPVSLLPTQDSSTASPLAAVFETRNFFFISFPRNTLGQMALLETESLKIWYRGRKFTKLGQGGTKGTKKYKVDQIGPI